MTDRLMQDIMNRLFKTMYVKEIKMPHRITELEIIPIRPNNGHVGFASFIFDQCFYMGSIAIHTRLNGGYRLTYPKKTGQQLNVFFPINKDIAKIIEEAVSDKFEQITNL
jgi:DNA-binding cell septation regulator SpoVG